jgi:hypothetical protein
MACDDSRRTPEETQTGESADVPMSADFSTFVISLSTSALFHLGEIPDPDGARPTLNLDMARHTIDLLSMLREKTAGNLSREESKLLGQFLYDLRMKYLARTKS